MNRFPVRASLLLFLILAVGVSLLIADGGANHQSTQQLPVELGTSGGNITDITNAFCCSGTLGSLVTADGTNYILSNNHILARTSQTTAEIASHVGNDISQPGLVDSSCRTTNSNFVADFSDAVPLGTGNVDAALAAIRSGAVNTTGEIIDVGIPRSSTESAAPDMAVAKSGRTTGLSCSTVTSVSTDVTVQYQKNCGSGRKFFINYTDQVVVGGSGFSAGGDSGSLIVSQADAAPVALLYAGSSTSTIGNPVGDVLTALTAAVGSNVSFVGSANGHSVTCGGGGGGGGGKPPGVPPGPPQHAIDRATAAKNAHAAGLFRNPAVQGVGVGVSDSDPSEAVVVIYLLAGQASRPMPRFLDGVATKVIVTDRFQAYGWNEPEPKACSAK